MFAATLLAAALAVAPRAQTAPSAVQPPLAPSFRHYGVIDGLPSDAAYAVAQDQQGYIWIGSRDGLARFDAQDFRIFRHDPNDSASLPANDVSALLVDAQGRVWAGGEGNGLNLYRPENGGFTHWLHDPHDANSLSGNDVMSLAQDTDGSIWIGVYGGGLNRLAPNAHGFVHLRHRETDPSSLLSDNVTALAAMHDGGVWIGTDAGMQRMDAHRHLTRVILPGAGAATSVWQLRGVADGVDAATDAGLFHVDARGIAQRIGAAGVIYASLHDTEGGVWIAHQGGLELLQPDGTARQYKPHSGESGSLAGAMPLDLFADHEGGLWIALLDGGVAYLPPQWRAFDDFRHVPGDADSLAGDRVIALASSRDGALMVGGENGMLDRLDPRNGSVRHVNVATASDKAPVTALAEDRLGRLWIGRRSGLRVFDGAVTREVGTGMPILHRGVVAMLAARDGSIYFSGVGSGVARVDPRTLDVHLLGAPATTAEAREVITLREAADGSVWNAGGAGVARIKPDEDAFHFVPGVTRGAVDALAFGNDGTLWIARSGILQHYALRSGVARLLDTSGANRGWPAVYVDALQTDAAGRVWATTPRGMFRFDPAMRRVRFYATADGMADPEFLPRALIRVGDTLYAGSFGGVIAVQPNALHDSQQAPQVALAALRVRRDGRMLDLDPSGPIALRWNDRELTATASALSFIDPAHNHYRFRLAGFDPDWVDTGTRDTREFSSLRAGSYRLRVAAGNENSWSAASAPLRIRISAPPWATPRAWVAYVLATLLLLAFAAWTMRRRLNQRHRYAMIAQRQQLAEQANAAKTRFLASMAHEIRTPMTGVLGMTELLFGTSLDARQRDFADGIRRSGAMLMRQVNDALDLARIEVGKLELAEAPFDPAALLREVAALERGFAQQKNLTLGIEIAPDAPLALLGDALRVQQVLLNLVHNALKFTHHGGVRLRFRRETDGVLFAVIDSGVGLTHQEAARLFQRFEQTETGKRASGSGLGLSISRELATLMGGHIDVHSAPRRGSTFSVHLPLRECEPARGDAQVSAAVAPEKSSAHSLRVLVVEDDPVAAQIVTGLLQSQDHAASHAHDALAALAELETTRDGSGAAPFTMILLDLDLPGMDGYAFARLLRARGSRIPIVAITAGSAGDEEQCCRDAGMVGFLRKPILPESLRRVLDEAMKPSGGQA